MTTLDSVSEVKMFKSFDDMELPENLLRGIYSYGFEVPSKMWFDLTDKSGKFGVSVLEDCKYGSDKPDNNTLRLTLQYTPSAKLCPTWLYQSSQDWGIQDFEYGLYGHHGDWSQSDTQDQAEFLNKP